MKISDYVSLFKSLSEPVRLRILYLLLEEGELCVCDLVTALELSQGVVSRHLAYLRNGGLVSARREGVWMYYKVENKESFMADLLNLFRTDGRKAIEFESDLVRLKTVANQCCE